MDHKNIQAKNTSTPQKLKIKMTLRSSRKQENTAKRKGNADSGTMATVGSRMNVNSYIPKKTVTRQAVKAIAAEDTENLAKDFQQGVVNSMIFVICYTLSRVPIEGNGNLRISRKMTYIRWQKATSQDMGGGTSSLEIHAYSIKTLPPPWNSVMTYVGTSSPETPSWWEKKKKM